MAHSVSDKVEAAYRRGDMRDKRRLLMRDWSAYCDGVAVGSDNVVAIGGGDERVCRNSGHQMLRVGQRCEDIQEKERKEQAEKQYKSRPEVKTLREAQDMVSGKAIDEDGDPITPTIAVEGANPADEDAEEGTCEPPRMRRYSLAARLI